MHRPLIGITTSINEDQQYLDELAPFVMLPVHYANAVREAGGEPLLIPEGRPEAAMELLARLDGLVLAGGRDIEPKLYAEEVVHPKTFDTRQSQDEWEAALFKAAQMTDVPVLGICRGHQLMCVCSGGKLHQHLPDLAGSERRHEGQWDSEWPVVVSASTRLADSIVGQEAQGIVLSVKIGNHQGVADAGSLSVAARSISDSLIEAAEDTSKRFCVSVQWHPEYSDDRKLDGEDAIFVALVTAARQVAVLRARIQLVIPSVMIVAAAAVVIAVSRLLAGRASRHS
mmetsp:Transcript_18110/g.46319  ORF Transcript_18110/g.46319 Transcript_18110/m.46319 type:complete len:285 (-) Transcript_18110:127-981(-)